MLVLFDALVFLDRLSGDGRGGFTGGRVVLLGVRGGRGDRAPGFATRHSECHGAARQQRQYDGFNDFVNLVWFHNAWFLNSVQR